MLSLFDRMKTYEDACRTVFPLRMPIFIRVDGRSFHSVTRGCEKPIDRRIEECMNAAAVALLDDSGGVVGYTQSDEITVMLTPYLRFESQAWFGGVQQKLASIAAAVATNAFLRHAMTIDWKSDAIRHRIERAMFDGRAYVVPREDAPNVFLARQNDCRRNAILGQAQVQFGKKNIHGMSCAALEEKLAAKGIEVTGADLMGRVVVKSGTSIDGKTPAMETRVHPAPNFHGPSGHHDFQLDLFSIVWPSDEES